MDRSIPWLDELLNRSLARRNSFRRRSPKERLDETSKFPWKAEGTNSLTEEKITENYEVTNKVNRSIEIKYKKGTSISAHTFLSNLNKQTAWSYKGESKPSFDTSNFSKAITEASNSSKEESFQTPNNKLPGGNNFTEESSCFCPSCSRLNLLSEGSDVLKALAPQETPRYTTLSDNINFENTFFLHSNHRANHTIYLDFDGFSINSTPWENGGSMSLNPFYVDLDLPTVQEEIQHIWNRVSADFAPFNINVTTEEPDIEDLKNSGGGDQRWGIRVALTSNQNRDNLDFYGNPREITNAGGGGTAFFNSFNWSNDDVALVFNQGEYAASETVSHEVGHALNLRHDGTNRRTDNPTYYEGHGTGQVSWASIMGASFIGDDENVTTWSKGEYNDANNLEDDLSIITSGNGFGYRTDDHANEFNLASSLNYSEINPLNPSETNILTHGIIETNDDIDYFTFQTSSGYINLDISNTTTAYISDGSGNYESQYLNPRGANLDISATLYDSSWGLVATSNPNNFLSAGFDNLALDGGTYFLTVEGVGTGDPFNANPTGYTSYASLGEYLINGSVVTTEANLRLTPIDSIKTEGNEGVTTFRFDILLSEARQNQVTVDWSVSGNNSSNAADFVNGLQFGTAVINAGETRAQVEVYVQGDREIEDDETFLVELSNARDSEGDSIELITSSAIATIEADDAEIRGRAWKDLNENGAVDENERGLEGIKVFIDTNLNNQLDPEELFTLTNEQGDYSFLVNPGSYSISTDLDYNQTQTFPSGYSSEVEPDSFTQGTVLNSINELAVLSAVGSSISNQDVTALAQDYVSTGTLGLSSSWNGGLWNTGNAELRVDFALPTDEVRIDFISDDSSDFGHMRAYDSSSNLLEEYVTQDLGTGIVETMTISRTNPEIAYILASGKDGQFGYLDNLRFSSQSGDSPSIEVTVGAEISINNDFGIAVATPPTIAISSSSSSLEVGQTALISFTLSEESSDFTLADISVSNGFLSDFSGSGSSYTAVFSPDSSGATQASIFVASNTFSDASGNFNQDGNEANNSLTFSITPPPDTTPPTIAISSSSSSLEVGQTALISFTLSEESSDFTLADISVSNGFLSDFSGSGSSYTAVFSPDSSGATQASIFVASNTFSDASGNFNQDGNEANNSLTFSITPPPDTTPPTIAISSSSSSLEVGQTALISFTLSEESSDFTLADISVSNGFLSDFSGSGSSYTAVFSPDSSGATQASIFVASNTFSDASGNFNQDGNEANNSLTFSITPPPDTTPPTIAISSSSSSLEVGQTALISFTLSEESSDFTLADISVSNGFLSDFSGSGSSYTAVFSPDSSGATQASIFVASNTFSDASGNFNQDGNEANNSLTFSITPPPDTTPPTIAISSSSSSLEVGQTALISFTLSEESSDFTLADISVSNGFLSDFSGSGSSYTAVFSPDSSGATQASIFVASNTFSDASGNFNQDGNEANNSLTFSITPPPDTTPPTIAISSSSSSLEVGQTALISFTLSEESSDFTLADISVSNGFLSDFSGSGSSYTAVFSPDSSGATQASIFVASNTFSDASGNFNQDGNEANNSLTFSITPPPDTTPPTIAISSSSSSLEVGQTALISFTLSEESSDFTLADISVSNGFLSDFSGSGSSYTAVFSPDSSGATQASIFVASNTFSDASGNFNQDGNEANNSLTFSITPPPPSLSISANEPAQPEGAPGDTTSFLFTVTRTGDTSSSSSAEYTVAGSGSNPANTQDFSGNSFPSGVVNFAAGEITQTIPIEVDGDSILEQDETFSVTLTSPTNASISPSNASAIATISNDDSPPQTSILFEETFEDSATWESNWGLDTLTGWQQSSRRATEGTWSGEVNGNVNNGSITSLAIDLSGNYSSATLNFDWRIQRNLDNNEFVSLDISNDNGDSWTQDIRTLRGNIDPENLWIQETLDLTSFIGSQEVLIRFRGTMNGQRERVNVDAIRVTAENIINGIAPTLSISANEPAQPEGAPGDTTSFLFTVTRTGDTSSSSSAEYTVAGSGSNPANTQDFSGNSFPSGVVNFAAGEITQTIPIEVDGDSILEQDETFSVTLTSPTNASISPSNASAIATISNDDSPPQTSILFEETFEDSATWESNWGLDTLTGWQQSSRRATEGTWSGEVNGNVNNGSITSLAIDLSGNYSSATLNFDWRIQRNLDNNEFVSLDISNDNGDSWTQDIRTLRGNIDPENLWIQETLDLTSFIGSQEVLIRFRGTMNGRNERANVDDINISATSGSINGQLRSENFEDSQNRIDDLLEVVKPLPDTFF